MLIQTLKRQPLQGSDIQPRNLSIKTSRASHRRRDPPPGKTSQSSSECQETKPSPETSERQQKQAERGKSLRVSGLASQPKQILFSVS